MAASAKTIQELLHLAPGDRTAIIIPELNLRITYDMLRQQVQRMADALASAGIRRGDRVATVLPNGLPAIVAFLASTIAGTAAPLNPAYPYEEFFFFLEDTAARLLITGPTGTEKPRAAALDRKIPVLTVEMTAQGTVRLLNAPRGGTATPPTAEDVALVLHTSGSTGRPKRVPLEHVNLAISASNIAATYSLTQDDVSLCIMPLYHIHGLMASTMAQLLVGGTVVVPAKFNALGFWKTVRDFNVTWYSGVPTMHQLLLARTREKPTDAATLRFIRSASAPLAPEVIHKMEEVFGVPFVEAYGMTEASHQMSSNPLPPHHRKPGSVGPPTGIRITVLDLDGNEIRAGERGEVAIQGPSVFKGYENNPEANAHAFVNGWFRTGDQGLLDHDGYLHLTGRIKDLIIRGGENVSPREVDEVLLRHPAVAEACTFGAPHPTLGEEVEAAVVLHEVNGCTEAVLLEFCLEKLAEYKCPKKIHIVETIPTTSTGKIRRRVVADAILQEPR